MLCVNYKTVKSNIKSIRAKLNPDVKLCAVIKCNSYNLGIENVAPKIAPDIDWFAVSTTQDAIKIRTLNINKPILLLGACDDINKAIDNDVTITVTSLPELRDIINVGRAVKIHIKVNTGINRYGITSPHILQTIINITKSNPNIEITGLYTHFSHEATAPNGTELIMRQINRFVPYVALFKRHFPHGIVHASASGQFHNRDAQFNMVRIGKALFGGYENYQNAITLTAKIVAVQTLSKGKTVGYGGKFIAQKPTVIGIANIGYTSCGFLQSPMQVFIDDIKCEIIGSINMDTIAIDVTRIDNPHGKPVTIIGNQNGTRIMDRANEFGVSGARIICSMS